MLSGAPSFYVCFYVFMSVMNSATPNAAAKHDLLFNELACSFWNNLYLLGRLNLFTKPFTLFRGGI
jgi:hypothetical protein